MSTPFSWEKQYKRTWENLSDEEDETLILRKQPIYNQSPYKKGIIRHFHIIVDSSATIELNDFLPSFRYHITVELNNFIKKFYSENPISVLSLLTYRNNKCEKYEILDVKSDIEEFFKECGTGEFSLIDSINVSLDFLNKNDYIKEILVITSSLYTVGIEKLKNLKDIKIHFISMRGDVYFYKNISQNTHGRYCVPVDHKDISFFLNSFCFPNSVNSSSATNLLKLGFPQILTEYLVCACCFVASNEGFECPVCNTKVCQLPIKCPICKTQLVNSTILSQFLYYCFPLDKFEKATGKCRVCDEKGKEMCGDCKSVYCAGCSHFLHNDLCFCFYCESF